MMIRTCTTTATRAKQLLLFSTAAATAPTSSASSSYSHQWQHATVVTSRHLISTNVQENFGIPLTVADVHLRNEQLPFAYFFPTPLSKQDLLASLKATLPHFPVLGGAVADARCLSIVCQTTDSIPCTFATSDQTLDFWLQLERRNNILRRQQSPHLLPLFDSLVTASSDDEAQHQQEDQPNLASIQITQLQDGATVIGMTVNHMAADAASCFHFVECWGNQHYSFDDINSKNQKQPLRRGVSSRISDSSNVGMHATTSRNNPKYRRRSNDRALVTWSGMMTDQTADAMGLIVAAPFFPSSMSSWLPAMLQQEPPDVVVPQPILQESVDSDHEYIHLAFPTAVLGAMKAHGMAHSGSSGSAQMSTAGTILFDNFVSSNDMMTAFGWLMKRELSGQPDSNVSMVVNLRGRCGVDAMMDDNGLFGNGIVNFIARIPEQATNEDHHQQRYANDVILDESSFDRRISMDDISIAALAIRHSLVEEIRDTPDRLLRSRLGQPPSSRTAAAGPCFSTTAWGAFPFWDKIEFGAGVKMVGFHGQPSHPMPPGNLFASVIVPNDVDGDSSQESGGGFTYQLLAPKNKEQQARIIHKRLSALFVEWHADNSRTDEHHL